MKVFYTDEGLVLCENGALIDKTLHESQPIIPWQVYATVMRIAENEPKLKVVGVYLESTQSLLTAYCTDGKVVLWIPKSPVSKQDVDGLNVQHGIDGLPLKEHETVLFLPGYPPPPGGDDDADISLSGSRVYTKDFH